MVLESLHSSASREQQRSSFGDRRHLDDAQAQFMAALKVAKKAGII